jgi:hypothetical protein
VSTRSAVPRSGDESAWFVLTFASKRALFRGVNKERVR